MTPYLRGIFSLFSGMVFVLVTNYGNTLLAQSPLRFEKEVLELKDKAEDEGPAEFRFSFWNVSEKPILINCKSSSGAVTCSWPKAPILPGDSGIIEGRFLLRGRFGPQNKSITVLNAAPEPNEERLIKILRFKMYIYPGPARIAENYPAHVGCLRISNSNLELQYRDYTQSAWAGFTVYNPDTLPVAISLRPASTQQFLELSKTELILGPRRSQYFNLQIPKGTDFSTLPRTGELQLQIGNAPGESFVLPWTLIFPASPPTAPSTPKDSP